MYADMYTTRQKEIRTMVLAQEPHLRTFQMTGHVQYAVLEQKAFHLNKSKISRQLSSVRVVADCFMSIVAIVGFSRS